jgi:hypothetical protein
MWATSSRRNILLMLSLANNYKEPRIVGSLSRRLRNKSATRTIYRIRIYYSRVKIQLRSYCVRKVPLVLLFRAIPAGTA